MNRRGFVTGGLGALAVGGGLWLGGFGGEITVEKMEVSLPLLPIGWEGWTVVALSDFHLYPFTEVSFLKRAFGVARQLKADVVVLLGDFVDSTVDAIDELVPALGDLDARLGVFAVLGNHDHLRGRERVLGGLSRGGVEVLDNRGIELSGPGGSGVWFGGMDSQAGAPDLIGAARGRRVGMCSVLLSHEPDIADEVSAGGGFHLQLSGHSHGGQVNVPWLVQGVLPRWGRKYAFGSYRVGDLLLHTNRGLGVTGVPFRYRSAPEISQITLVRGEIGMRRELRVAKSALVRGGDVAQNRAPGLLRSLCT